MIIVVDDDAAVREFVSETLKRQGYEVKTFDDATEALKFIPNKEPELIISDVMMPAMGGFEFREAYSRSYPNRMTPFIFLSSLSETENIVKGLELGADDYLTKPIPPEILVAKVKSHLTRKLRYTTPLFHGDLGKIPFVKVMQFCELKGLTGKVEIDSGEVSGTINFRSGQLEVDQTDDSDDLIEKLFDLTEGVFVIHSQPVEFQEIETASLESLPQATEAISPLEKPMGLLSGVKLQDKLFQIQTEFVTYPENQVVTIVILDGKSILKRKSPTIASPNKEKLEKLINEQHHAVEQEVNEKINTLTQKKAKSEESSQDKFNALFQQGMDKYLDKDYAGALALWEEAYKIDPTNQLIEMNLKIVRKKIEA
jgi:DNA-binding response OmpR family regulator